VEQGVGWQGECTACHQRGPWRETETAALGAWLSFADSVDAQNIGMRLKPEAHQPTAATHPHTDARPGHVKRADDEMWREQEKQEKARI
jgi:hypothetical protein